MGTSAETGDELVPGLGVPEVDAELDGVWLCDFGQGNLGRARAAADALGDEPASRVAKAVTAHLQGDLALALDRYEQAWVAAPDSNARRLIAAMARRAVREQHWVAPDGTDMAPIGAVRDADAAWDQRYRALCAAGNPAQVNSPAWLIYEIVSERPRWRSADAHGAPFGLPRVVKQAMEVTDPAAQALALLVCGPHCAEVQVLGGDRASGFAILDQMRALAPGCAVEAALLRLLAPRLGRFEMLGYRAAAPLRSEAGIGPWAVERDTGDLDEAEQLLEAAASENTAPRARARAELARAHIEIARRRWEQARGRLVEAEKQYSLAGDALGCWTARLGLVVAAARTGAITSDITRSARWLVDVCRQKGLVAWEQAAGRVLIAAARESADMGDVEAMLKQTDAAQVVATATGDRLQLGDLHAVRAWGLSSANAISEARVEIDAAHREWRAFGEHRDVWHRQATLLWTEFALAVTSLADPKRLPDARAFREHVLDVLATSLRPSDEQIAWAEDVHRRVVADFEALKTSSPRCDEAAHAQHGEATEILLDRVTLQGVERLERESAQFLSFSLVRAAMARDDTDGAQAAARRALGALAGRPDESYWAALVHEALGDLPRAKAALDRFEADGCPALPLLTIPGIEVPARADPRRLVAQLRARIDDFEGAGRLYGACGIGEDGTGLPWETAPENAVVDAVEIARLCAHRGDFARALQLLERAAEVVEVIRAALHRESNRRALGSATWASNVYATWASLLCTAGAPDRAFDVAELARARSLVELAVAADADDADHLRRQLTHLEFRLEELTIRLAQAPPADSEALIRERRDLLHQHGEIEVALAEKSPVLLQARLPRKALLGMAAAAKYLGKDDLLLAYQFADHELLLWAISSSGLIESGRIAEIDHQRFRSARARAWMEDWLAALREDGERELELGRKVASFLLPFPEVALRYRNVIVCPWGPVAAVPFHALPVDAVGQRVGDSCAVSVLPAITLMRFLQARAGERRGALVVGDPWNMAHPKLGALDPLPAARLEASVAASRLGVEPLLGRAASRGELLARVGRQKILHLASHGWYAEHNPLASSIALAGGENLSAADLQTSAFDIDLAVLSACDVGQGNPEGGELVGFSRSLLVAGARAVAIGLWRAPDTATLFLMDAFYQHWGPTCTAARALASARQDLRAMTAAQALDRLNGMRTCVHGSGGQLAPLLEASACWVESDLRVLQGDLSGASSALGAAIPLLESCDAQRELALARRRKQIVEWQRTGTEGSPAARVFERPSQWAPLALIGDWTV